MQYKFQKKYIPVIQKRNYDCGVAATYAALINSGMKVGYKKLEAKLKLTKNGVSYTTIARFLRNFTELKPIVKVNARVKSLVSLLNSGRICIVVYQSWGKPHEVESLECGHYAVAVRATKTKIYLLDPGAHTNWGDGKGWRIMNLAEFKEKWIDKEYNRVVKGWMVSVKPLI